MKYREIHVGAFQWAEFCEHGTRKSGGISISSQVSCRIARDAPKGLRLLTKQGQQQIGTLELRHLEASKLGRMNHSQLKLNVQRHPIHPIHTYTHPPIGTYLRYHHIRPNQRKHARGRRWKEKGEFPNSGINSSCATQCNTAQHNTTQHMHNCLLPWIFVYSFLGHSRTIVSTIYLQSI